VFLGFLLAALVGTALLLLPAATPGPGGADPLVALFTAVSAVCVTGLIVVDTPTAWTTFGQVVILGLIQLGGLGVMTFASVVGLAVVRRLSLRGQLTAASETKQVGLADARRMVGSIVRISFVIEAATAVVLTVRFALGYGYEWRSALWHGVFHAVSSFNNAGFALHSDSLIGFARDPWVILPICAAIILGGLGFPVIVQLRRDGLATRLWSMNTRLVIVGTAGLLVLGTVGIAALEWSNPATLAPMDVPGRLLVAFTQSVQTRTAGFNSVDVASMDPSTWLVMDVLMFIGGGSAGTAGGVKVTTFLVLFFIMVTEIRGDTAVNVFGKRLSRAVHRQAITVALLAVATVIAAAVWLSWITDFALDDIFFEVISAFATVGMSTGITAALPAAGQLTLVLLMFVGRLGPMSFAAALALRERHPHFELPKERPLIG
jgi:trk system potassium uptake protein